MTRPAPQSPDWRAAALIVAFKLAIGGAALWWLL